MNTTIVIATSGDRIRLLERTLTSLSEQHFLADIPKVFIVENGKIGSVQDLLQSFSSNLSITYAYERVGNKSRALNCALDEVRSSFLLFLDDDVRLSKELVSSYVTAAEMYGPRHFFGGPTACDYERKPSALVARYLPLSAKGWTNSDEVSLPGTRTHFLGFNWAAFADDLRNVGGFDTDFGPGSLTGATGQETTMQDRLMDDGVAPIYVKEAMVWHYVPVSRCTPEWVIGRQARSAKERCLNPHGFEGYPLGVLGYAILNFIRTCCMALVSTVGHSASYEFRTKVYSSRVRGVCQGLQMVRRRRRSVR